MDDDVAAGPELPSGPNEEAVDDEDGRFFGGGITSDTAEVLDFIDGRDKDDVMVSRSPFYIKTVLVANMELPETRDYRFCLGAKTCSEL